MRTLPWLVCLLAAASPCLAADDDVAGWQLHWDNDVWAKGSTDRWYTNGIRLGWAYNKRPDNELAKLFIEGSRWLQWNDGDYHLAYSVGQTMYTPQNIALARPQPDDRPWGAFLYFGASTNASRKKPGSEEFRSTELKLGTTGPHALGEQFQEFVHKVGSAQIPQGWHQQLRARPGIQLSHTRVYMPNDHGGRDYFGFQYGWGVAAGTLRNHANINGALLVGNLRGTATPMPMSNEGDFVTADFNNRALFKRLFAYAAVNVTGVASNYFIEGSTPYGRSRLEAKRSYTVVQAGVSIPLQCWFGKRWPRLVYAQSTRSPEFRNSVTGREGARQRWGTFSFNWDIDDGTAKDC